MVSVLVEQAKIFRTTISRQLETARKTIPDSQNGTVISSLTIASNGVVLLVLGGTDKEALHPRWIRNPGVTVPQVCAKHPK